MSGRWLPIDFVVRSSNSNVPCQSWGPGADDTKAASPTGHGFLENPRPHTIFGIQSNLCIHLKNVPSGPSITSSKPQMSSTPKGPTWLLSEGSSEMDDALDFTTSKTWDKTQHFFRTKSIKKLHLYWKTWKKKVLWFWEAPKRTWHNLVKINLCSTSKCLWVKLEHCWLEKIPTS